MKNLQMKLEKEKNSSTNEHFFIDLMQSSLKKCCGDCKNSGNCHKGQSHEAHTVKDSSVEQNQHN